MRVGRDLVAGRDLQANDVLALLGRVALDHGKLRAWRIGGRCDHFKPSACTVA